MIFVGHPGKGSGQDKKISGIVFHNNYPIFDLKTLSAGGFQLKESYRTNIMKILPPVVPPYKL